MFRSGGRYEIRYQRPLDKATLGHFAVPYADTEAALKESPPARSQVPALNAFKTWG
jgi:hypothetical protein